MNRGPVGGARLWGPVVSPLLHAEAGIDYRPGRLPAGEERGRLKGRCPRFDHRGTHNTVHVFVRVHVSPCV